MLDWLTADNLVALLTLSALEIVLGIDNVVFISILSGKLPKTKQATAQRLGLILAMAMRILLLFLISWVMGLTQPLFSILNKVFSGRDLILLLGGLFLIGKSTSEIHSKLEGAKHGDSQRSTASFTGIIIQILALDVVFSLDSVITAVGMAQQLWVMVTAVIVAVLVMMIFAGPISRFVEKHPTFKMLALAFLLLIGVMLTAEGLGSHISKAYIYFAMAFSLFVEILNMKLRKKTQPVKLHKNIPQL